MDDLHSVSPVYQTFYNTHDASKISIATPTFQNKSANSDIYPQSTNDTIDLREQKEACVDLYETMKECNGRAISAESHERAFNALHRIHNINIQDKNGDTVLHHVINEVSKNDSLSDILDAVLSRPDIDVDRRNKKSVSPLDSCIVYNQTAIVKKLLPKKCNLDSVNSEHETALHICCKYGTLNEEIIAIVKLLLDFGANPDIQDKYLNTPLHYAAKKGYADVVKLLLKNKANNCLVNQDKLTALEVCEEKSIRKILEDYDPASKTWKWFVDHHYLKYNTDNEIGKGEFGIVYKAKMHGTDVALKLIRKYPECNLKRPTREMEQSLLYEAGLMCDIRHSNILSFMGLMRHDDKLGIITEYCAKGNLRNYIQSNTLVFTEILTFAMGTAKGLAWLHSRFPPILHRDLHTKNILITQYGECKVSDFGLSQLQGSFIKSKQFYQRIMPPELKTTEKVEYTKKSDVYMFGLILFELLTTQKAFGEITYEMERLYEKLKGKAHCVQYLDVIRSCCHENPHKRPNFEDIISQLETIESPLNDDTFDKIEEFRQEQSVYI